MKKILTSLFVLTLLITGVVAATRAYFYDEEVAEGNTFAAGAIDLMVDYTSTYNDAQDASWTLKDLTPSDQFFNIADAKPGDYGEGTISLHVFNNDAYLYGQITPVFDDDFSSTEPELEVPGEIANDPADAWDGELGQNLDWEIWVDDGLTDGWQCAGVPGCLADSGEGDNLLQLEETEIITGTAADIGQSPTGWIYLGELDSTETYYIGAAWNIDISVGNEIQTDRYQMDIAFMATQQRHLTPGVLPTP